MNCLRESPAIRGDWRYFPAGALRRSSSEKFRRNVRCVDSGEDCGLVVRIWHSLGHATPVGAREVVTLLKKSLAEEQAAEQTLRKIATGLIKGAAVAA
jgi:hypothetical protein